MRSAPAEQMQGGLCQDLPPAVVDKYWMANGLRSRFAFMTAKVICANCPVLTSCLEDAIVEPPGYGVRAGESSYRLWQLHSRWMGERIDAAVLATEAISRQHARLSLQVSERNGSGRFPDVPLAYPELGGAA